MRIIFPLQSTLTPRGWIEELKDIRQRASANRSRARGDHFSSANFLQIPSRATAFWEPPANSAILSNEVDGALSVPLWVLRSSAILIFHKRHVTSVNQSINQWIDEVFNQWVNQSINQWLGCICQLDVWLSLVTGLFCVRICILSFVFLQARDVTIG